MRVSTENVKRLKKIAENGGIIKGTHVFCGSPMLTEAMAMIGFDAVWIDMEHTAIGKSEVLNNLIAIRAGGSTSFVRIPWNDPVLAKPIIDMGTDGIIFPFIRTVEDAKAAIAACEYPPKGTRGYGPLRALDYGGIDKGEFVHDNYRDMLRIIQIEHIDAVNCLEELVGLDGIDGFLVGPNDLSGSVGRIGNDLSDDMNPIYDRIGEILKDSGKIFGVATGPNEKFLSDWIRRGVNLIFTGTDVSFVYDGSRLTYNMLTELEKQRR